MRAAFVGLGLASFVTTGCVFLVDFDELKQGATDAGGMPTDPSANPGGAGNGGGSGNGGTGPGPSGGGTGGEMPGPGGGGSGTLCASDCVDGDPCTQDICGENGCENPPVECMPTEPCMAAQCVDGACIETPTTGVVADGFEDAVVADQVYRTTLVGADDRFFHAVYGVFDGVNDLRLGAFDATGDVKARTQELAAALGTSFEIASPGALVADTRATALALNVYVGVRFTEDGVTSPLGEVLRIAYDRDVRLASTMAKRLGSAPSYRFVSNQLGPAASQVPGLEPFVIWTGERGGDTPGSGLLFQTGDDVVGIDDPGTNFIPTTEELSGLQAVYTDSVPGAVWMTDAVGGGVHLYSATNTGGIPSELTQCDVSPGLTGYSLNARLTFDNLWTVSWAKQGATFTSENSVVQCSGMTCVDGTGLPLGQACAATDIESRVNPDVRNLTVESFADPTDPDYLYQIIMVAAGQGDGVTLAVVVNRVNITPSGGAAVKIGNANIVTGEGASAPSWPEVAVLPPDKLAISWIQPTEDGLGQEARFARYRICTP